MPPMTPETPTPNAVEKLAGAMLVTGGRVGAAISLFGVILSLVVIVAIFASLF